MILFLKDLHVNSFVSDTTSLVMLILNKKTSKMQGHDLSLENIEFFKQNIPNLAEVSIGHALISESLYLGLENVVNMYIHRLQ